MKGINSLLFLFLSSCAQKPYSGNKLLDESLRQCYVESDSYTGKSGTVQGSMTVRLQVLADGKVKSCEVIKNSLTDPNLKACVCGIFKQTNLKNPTQATAEVIRSVNFQAVEQ